MGVFKLSSCLIYVGVATRGLRSSEGYDADRGVFRDESCGFCCVVAMVEERSEIVLQQHKVLSV